MVWRRAYAGMTESAHDARVFVGFLLACFPRRDDVVQAAGELIANALTHTRSAAPGGTYIVEVRSWRGGVAISVVDQGGANEPRTADGDLGEHGYGLVTVRALASSWGWSGDQGGRTVSAIFSGSRP
jgi:anti-sigma regulatory factor (Ser/Thr protein kinase)